MSHSALYYLFVRQLRSPWTPSIFTSQASVKAPSRPSGRSVTGRRALPIGAAGK